MSTSCILCGSDRSRPLLKAPSPDDPRGTRYVLVECARCSLVRVDPLPDKKVLDSLYSGSYYGQWTSLQSATPIATFARFVNALLIQQKRRKIEMVHHKKGRVLDFGCGNGEFVWELHKNGWDAYGMDPSLDVVHGLPPVLSGCVEKNLQPFLDKEWHFDVITMWHVLEHLADPRDTLDQIRRLLTHDGLLFVAVPNFASWEARCAGSRWFHLDMPRHLYHYTPRTATSLLSRFGFEIKRIHFLSVGYNAFGLFQTLLNWMTPEMNFLYNQWKRGTDYRKIMSFQRYVMHNLLTYSLAVPLAPIALILSSLAGLFGRSGTLEIYAHLKFMKEGNSSLD